MIDVDQVVRLLEQVLAPKTLKPLQRLIIQASWQGLSYLQMAEVYQYDAGHLRDMGSELWQELSQVLRKRVQKRDLRGIVLQLAKSPFGQGKKDIAWIDSFVDQPFYGRETELQTLYHWLVGRSCRLISLNGLEGSGKTVLAATVAHQVILGTVIDCDFCPLNPPMLGNFESLTQRTVPPKVGGLEGL
ncbi:MAG: hypothetical protein ACKO5Q_27025, partial [Microcystaceae cyanobacterium]